MNHATGPNQELIDRAMGGDLSARGQILENYRDYLRRMVAARLDRRLAPRVDASDVVQETLVAANAQLDEYFRDQALPLAAWLRRLASLRVADAHRRHVEADRRSVRARTACRTYPTTRPSPRPPALRRRHEPQ